MIVAFDILTLHCACGSSAIMCIDPGRDAEMDPVFDIVARRPVAARGWCLECFNAFAARLPHEMAKV